MSKRILYWLLVLALLAVIAWGVSDIANGWAP